MIKDSAGSIFAADLLAGLPPDALPHVRAVLKRHAGTVMHIPRAIEREDQRNHVKALVDAGATKEETITRLMIRWRISRLTATRWLKKSTA